MTMSAMQAREAEDDPDVTTTLRTVCRWRREEPTAFHALLDHVLATTPGAPPDRVSLSPVEEVIMPCPKRGELGARVRQLLSEDWLSAKDLAVKTGGTHRSVMDVLSSSRAHWVIERRWRKNAWGNPVKQYRMAGKKSDRVVPMPDASLGMSNGTEGLQ